MEALGLYVSAPVASFRLPQAREYLETLPLPPPSTLYGCLLSLVGEVDRFRHAGAQVAVASLGRPWRSTVLRTVWRVKNTRIGPGHGANKRPDFQELLTGVSLAIWVRPGLTELSPSLAERVAEALAAPSSVQRFGGLALGESTHLVDEFRPLRPTDGVAGEFLISDAHGYLACPVWPDHVGSAGTLWLQARLEERPIAEVPAEDCWITVGPTGE